MENPIDRLNKLPKNTYTILKNSSINLFHISPKKSLTNLTPRISFKPFKDEENTVPRISVAPDVDSCFRAIGLEGIKDKETFYIYKLITDKNTILVKPTTKLVPDRDRTNEHWVITPTKAKKIGSITVKYNKDEDKFEFDASDMPENIEESTNIFESVDII